jgi:hypothetical protein
MEKDDDRSVHISGPVKNSPISSGNFHGPVTYNDSENTEARQSNMNEEYKQAISRLKFAPEVDPSKVFVNRSYNKRNM